MICLEIWGSSACNYDRWVFSNYSFLVGGKSVKTADALFFFFFSLDYYVFVPRAVLQVQLTSYA